MTKYASAKRASDDELQAWAENIEESAWLSAYSSDISDSVPWENLPEGKRFPPYYENDHYAYLLGLIEEVQAARRRK